MSEDVIVKYCSPTLAGIKTGSLFSGKCMNHSELFSFSRKLNVSLGRKGIRFIPLRFWDEKALVYAFRPSKLFSDIKDKQADVLLSQRGYHTDNCAKCLSRLIKRLNENEEFPHEIGLFLGYPVEDVKGFIENNAACAKCAGCWKVYGDEKKARRLFDQYRKCTRVYEKQWREGKPLKKLTVAK